MINHLFFPDSHSPQSRFPDSQSSSSRKPNHEELTPNTSTHSHLNSSCSTPESALHPPSLSPDFHSSVFDSFGIINYIFPKATFLNKETFMYFLN